MYVTQCMLHKEGDDKAHGSDKVFVWEASELSCRSETSEYELFAPAMHVFVVCLMTFFNN